MAIPASAKRIPSSMDPGDWRRFRVGASSLLDTAADEQIDPATLELEMSAEGALLGVEITDAGGREPTVIEEGTAFSFWLSVVPASQGNAAFNAGVDVAITVRFRTTAVLFSRFERTIVVRAVNR